VEEIEAARDKAIEDAALLHKDVLSRQDTLDLLNEEHIVHFAFDSAVSICVLWWVVSQWLQWTL
jgi:hypothetical protein